MRTLYLRWARPLAPAAVAIPYAVVYAIAPSMRVLAELLLLCGSVAASIVYLGVAYRFGDVAALRIGLPADTLLISGMAIAVGHPEFVAVVYFWSIGLAAFLLGPRDTLANGVLATACAAFVPYLTPDPVFELAHVTDVIVLALFTVLLAYMSRQTMMATETVEHERSIDAVALRLSERVRASHDADEIMHATVEEIGQAVGASRIRLRLGAVSVPSVSLHEWRRDDRPALEFTPPLPLIARTLETGESLLVADTRHAPPEIRQFVEDFGERSFLLRPVVWGERILAAIGIFCDRPRGWRRANALLERMLPQLAAALAQAEAYHDQVRVTRLRDELVANVSHELRTPLTATIGFLQTLERPDLDLPEDRRRELLEIARSEAQRLARLVDDLLELTRFERGSVPLVRAHIALAEVARRAAGSFETNGRRLRLDLDDAFEVVADGDRMQQVLTNLLGNALRHGAGEVVVRGTRAAGHVLLEVSDDGPGVPPERVDEIFEPFARWSASSESTGLGLPISRRIAEAHGGSISYRPARGGRPHAFVLSVPATRQA